MFDEPPSKLGLNRLYIGVRRTKLVSASVPVHRAAISTGIIRGEFMATLEASFRDQGDLQADQTPHFEFKRVRTPRRYTSTSSRFVPPRSCKLALTAAMKGRQAFAESP